MQNNELPSTADKSNKDRPVGGCSPIPFPEQSSILSLNLQDLKALMRKKERQYQNQMLIEDAQRVHNFIDQIEQAKKQASELSNRNCKITLKKEIMEYNRKTIEQFKQSWSQRKKENTLKYQEISKLLAEQHQKEIEAAKHKIQQIRSGRVLEHFRHSRMVFQLEDQLKKLVKTQRYQQAYLMSSKLQKTKAQEIKNFMNESAWKQQLLLQKLKKKQAKQRLESQKRRQSLQAYENNRYQKELLQLKNNLQTYQIDLKKVQNSVKRQDKQRNPQVFKHKKSFSFKNTTQILKQQVMTIINNESDAKQAAN